jgi:hypothetical protein
MTRSYSTSRGRERVSAGGPAIAVAGRSLIATFGWETTGWEATGWEATAALSTRSRPRVSKRHGGAQ